MIKKEHAHTLSFSVLLCVSLISFKTTFGQDSTYQMLKSAFVDVGFFYDVPQAYGISANLSYPFAATIKSYVRKDGNISTREKNRYWGLEATAYRYPYNYTGVLLIPFIGVRHYTHNSSFYETSLGVGLLRTFYDGKVYEVDASGNVKEKSLFGRFYVTTHVSEAFNFLLKKPLGKVLALQIKPSLWFQYPFESFIKPHLSLQAGIKYEINSRSVKTRMITKHSRK